VLLYDAALLSDRILLLVGQDRAAILVLAVPQRFDRGLRVYLLACRRHDQGQSKD